MQLETTHGKKLPALWEQGGRPKNTGRDDSMTIAAQIIAQPFGTTLKPIHVWMPKRNQFTGEIYKDRYFYSKQHALFVACTGLLVVQASVPCRLLDGLGPDAIHVRIYQIAEIINKGTTIHPAWEGECNLINARVDGEWKRSLDPRHRRAVDAALSKTQCVCSGTHFAYLPLESQCASARLRALAEEPQRERRALERPVPFKELLDEKSRRHLERAESTGEVLHKYV